MQLRPWTRYSPALRKVVFAAVDDASRRGQLEVGAENLLLSILNDPAPCDLYVLGISLRGAGDVRGQLEAAMPAAVLRRKEQAQRLSASSRRALELATTESERLRDRFVETHHVLLGLIVGTAGPAGQAMDRLGITSAVAREQLRRGRSNTNSSGDDYHPPTLSRLLPARIDSLVARATGPARRVMRLGYDVFLRRSLAHPGFVSNPYPLYRWLRRHEPVREDPILPAWIVTRYEDVATVLRDARFKRDPFNAANLPRAMQHDLGVEPSTKPVTMDVDLLGDQMLFVDPPRHTKLRAIFAKAFTPKVVQALRPRIEQIAHRLIEDVAGREQFDLIRDIAYPLPTRVIAELLGFPAGDYEQLKRWSDDFAALLALNSTGEQQARSAGSLEQMHHYFQRIVAGRRQEPKEDLISQLLAIEEAGDRLTAAELFANCVLLLAAGHETTTNLIGNGMLALLKHPDQFELLKQDPTLIESAVEELLRHDSPVQWTSRNAGETIELNGQRIAAGSLVLASLGAANHDPAIFENPVRLNIRRADNRHLAFGSGIHFCLGAALARLEGQITISALLARLPNLRLASRRHRWHGGTIFRGLRELPLRHR